MTIRVHIHRKGFNAHFVEYQNAGMLVASAYNGGIEIKVWTAGQFQKTWCDSFEIVEEWSRGQKPEIVKFPLE